MFGEGTYTGKGLLHVQAMHAVLHGRLPVDQVLSHDLLEGSLLAGAHLDGVQLDGAHLQGADPGGAELPTFGPPAADR